MELQEHETLINFDYFGDVVRIYTTREGVFNATKKRLGSEILKECEVIDKKAYWQIIVPMKHCRKPSMVVKLLNPDQKTKMPEGLFSKSNGDDDGEEE